MPRKPKRRGPGRPVLPAASKRSVRREVVLLPDEASSHDAAAKAESQTWGEWIRAAAAMAIARGPTR